MISLLSGACSPTAAPTDAPEPEKLSEPVEAEEPEEGEPMEEAPSYEGVSLTLFAHSVLYGNTGGDDGMVQEWMAATGATVNTALFDATALREKMLLEMTAHTGGFDVIFINYAWLNPETAQFLEPLDNYLASAAADYDFDDLIGSLSAAANFDGAQMAIPFRIGGSMLYYRTDLFEEYGVKPPETWDEFMAAAEALTLDTDNDGEIDIYGVVQRGRPGYELSQDFLRYAFAFGADLLNPEMTECVMDSDAGIAALDTFAGIYQKGYAPPDMQALGRDEYIAAMQQGRAAMAVYFSPYWSSLIGEDSLFAEEMGWIIVPHAPGVEPGRTQNAGWVLAINADSPNKEAAWDLVEYLTTKEAQVRAASDYSNGPVRVSTYDNVAYLEAFPLATDWAKAIAASIFEPPHNQYPQMQDILSEEIILALDGVKTSEEAMKASCERIDLLLE